MRSRFIHRSSYTVPEDYEDKAFGEIDEDDYDEVDELADAFPDVWDILPWHLCKCPHPTICRQTLI